MFVSQTRIERDLAASTSIRVSKKRFLMARETNPSCVFCFPLTRGKVQDGGVAFGFFVLGLVSRVFCFTVWRRACAYQ